MKTGSVFRAAIFLLRQRRLVGAAAHLDYFLKKDLDGADS